MTKQEVGKLLAVAQDAYLEQTKNWTDNDRMRKLNAWYITLEQYPYNLGSAALRSYLKNDKYNRFPGQGQIATIIEDIRTTLEPDDMTAIQAWDIVRPAIREGNYYAERDFEKFPQIIKDALRDASRLKEWANLPSETIDSVIRSDFCNRIFPTVVNRRKEYERYPKDVQALIDKTMEQNNRLTAQGEATSQTLEDYIGRVVSLEDKNVSQSDYEGDATDHSEQIEELKKKLGVTN